MATSHGDAELIARRELLFEAAAAFDRARAHLGPGEPALESVEGALARALAQDTVEFAADPVWYHITDRDFLSRSVPVPVRFTDLSRRFRFFWVSLPIALFPQRHWAFNRLDVIVQFNPGEPQPGRRPKAHQILPARRFQDLLRVSAGLEVRLDENFQFSAAARPPAVDAGVARAQVGAGVDARAAAGLGMVVGPFTYQIKNAQIDHTPVGMEMVRWRIEGAEFFQGEGPDLVVVLQVPRETERVTIAAAMEARRYFNWGAAGLQEAVKQLGDRLRHFFEDGLPVERRASWELDPSD